MTDILGGALSGINWSGMLSNIMMYVGIILLVIVLTIVGWFILHITSFRIKATVYPIFGGANGSLSIGKQTGQRFKWNKEKTKWKMLYPYFNKKEIEPFDPEYIHEGSKIYCFKIGQDYIPAEITVGDNVASVKPKSYSVQFWQNMEHRQNAMEFAETNWWTENKMLITILVCAGCCLVMVGLTVYFTYKFASTGRSDISGLTAALQNFGNIKAAAAAGMPAG
jgi:uncharacterized membrane protein